MADGRLRGLAAAGPFSVVRRQRRPTAAFTAPRSFVGICHSSSVVGGLAFRKCFPGYVRAHHATTASIAMRSGVHGVSLDDSGRNVLPRIETP